MIAALARRTGDLTLAEDAVQEAALAALTHWGRNGAPDRPEGWLIRVAFRKAIDRLRGQAREGRGAAALAVLADDEAALPDIRPIADERLALILTCCHPALEPKSRVALTLRTLCDLSTAEIARLWLDTEATMGQRISRAKAKIAAARIAFSIPEPADWPQRLGAVLDVIYLIYTLGHQRAPDSRDLRGEAIRLARLVDALRPGDPEIEALLALLLLTDARQGGRYVGDRLVPLAAQDRQLWDHRLIAEGTALLDRALARGGRGPFRIKAAIAALHDTAEGPAGTDWPQIEMLYAALLDWEPTDVVRLNRAVAQAEAGDPAGALERVRAMALDGYQPYHAALAHLLAISGDRAAATVAYRRAAGLSLDPGERDWLLARAEAVRAG
jgi:RNA polymerase sigma factor (sigma-70 family)